MTIRAVRIGKPPQIDGNLDEELYQSIPPVGDFIQQEPHEGEPATEQTDAWFLFDDRNVYVALRCWDSRPDQIVANEMRRDSVNITNAGDSVTVVFDTFHDRRTGFFFQTNALGAIRDALVTAEGNHNYDWNTVWEVKSRRFDRGWMAEMVIPFKSLRYRDEAEQIWGVNIRRIVRSRNEFSHLTRLPASYGPTAVSRFSLAATLVGIETPVKSRNVEIKPYAISELTTNREAAPPTSNDVDGRFGFDAKYGLTRSLIVDFTYNTDFAQVEADEQQVNLTRFNLQFPEKREFFLEGKGLYEFGGERRAPAEMPVLFFSRNIGLSNSQTVPIAAGGRLTGRVGKYAIGLLNIQTKDSARARAVATNFSVARVTRDLFRRSTVGIMATRRSPAFGAGSSEAFGADADLKFFKNVEVNTYYAATHTSGVEGDASSYRARVAYIPDRYGVELERIKVGEAFKPAAGFLRRTDFRRDYVELRFSPRPTSLKGIRKLTWQPTFTWITNGEERLENRELQGLFRADLENGDAADVSYAALYEYLAAPFRIAPGVVVPGGGYSTHEVQVNYRPGPQRRVTGVLNLTRGSFYSGHRTQTGYSGRVEVTSQVSLEPRISFNWVDLEEGRFVTKLIGARTTYTLSPQMFVGALVQYNSSANSVTTNVRFRWEYTPGSDLFVVYSQGDDTASPRAGTLANRGLAVKYTRLFRF